MNVKIHQQKLSTLFKKEKKNEQKLRDLWDNTKSSGIDIITISEGQKKWGRKKNGHIYKLTNS